MQDQHAGHNNDSISQAALTLSDIIHTMSPSPAPQPAPDPFPQFPHEHHSPIIINSDEPDIGTPYTSESPGPPDPEEFATIHAKVQELGILDADLSDSSITAREKWLAETLYRLTANSTPQPTPAQLETQAVTIYELTQQRNFLLHENVEQHNRWDAERHGWDRMAEALLMKKRTASLAAGKDDTSERQISRLEDQNKHLQEKLDIATARMRKLEQELIQLRPVLLMQPAPTPLTDPHLFSQPAIPTASTKPQLRKRASRKGKEKETEVTSALKSPNAMQIEDGDIEMELIPADQDPSEASASINPSTRSLRSAHNYSHYRSKAERERDLAFPYPHGSRGRTRQTAKDKAKDKEITEKGMPLLTDARAECLLVASRKIGAVRAGVLSGLVKEREWELAKERDAENVRKKARERKERQRERERAKGMTLGGPPMIMPDGTPGHRPLPPNMIAIHPQYLVPSHLHPGMPPGSHPGIIYFNSNGMPMTPMAQVPGSSGMPMLVPMPPGAWPIPGNSSTTPTHTPLPAPTPMTGRGQAEDQTQPTGASNPMDSLLSAARTMMVDATKNGANEERGASSKRKPAIASSGNSTSKRRKVISTAAASTIKAKLPTAKSSVRQKKAAAQAQAQQQNVAQHSVPPADGRMLERVHTRADPPGGARPIVRAIPIGVTRVRSALDVLADQAAQEQERRPSVDPSSRRQSPESEDGSPPASVNGTSSSKNKGKAQASTKKLELSNAPRGRSRSSTQERDPSKHEVSLTIPSSDATRINISDIWRYSFSQRPVSPTILLRKGRVMSVPPRLPLPLHDDVVPSMSWMDERRHGRVSMTIAVERTTADWRTEAQLMWAQLGRDVAQRTMDNVQTSSKSTVRASTEPIHTHGWPWRHTSNSNANMPMEIINVSNHEQRPNIVVENISSPVQGLPAPLNSHSAISKNMDGVTSANQPSLDIDSAQNSASENQDIPSEPDSHSHFVTKQPSSHSSRLDGHTLQQAAFLACKTSVDHGVEEPRPPDLPVPLLQAG